MLFKKRGITGYNISLETSVNKLTSESIQMGRVIILFFASKSIFVVKVGFLPLDTNRKSN
jgi:hypothetical protein